MIALVGVVGKVSSLPSPRLTPSDSPRGLVGKFLEIPFSPVYYSGMRDFAPLLILALGCDRV